MSVDQGHATNVVAHVAIRRLFRSGHVTRYAATTWLRQGYDDSLAVKK